MGPLEWKTACDDIGTFSGYASVFGRRDLENEIVSRGAFSRSLDHHKGRFVLLWQHKKEEVIGEVYDAREDDTPYPLRDRSGCTGRRGHVLGRLHAPGDSELPTEVGRASVIELVIIALAA